MNTRKSYIIIIIVVVLGTIFIGGILLFSSSTRYSQDTPLPFPTKIPEEIKLPFTKSAGTLPTLPPDKGQGIDIQSSSVKDSEAEINKLSASLPFTKDLPLSTGITVSIVIPDSSLFSNPWTLPVQIFNIDYAVTPQDAEYDLMKKSFREAANEVSLWMKGQGANPEKIIIQWGDKAYIQKKAEEWLKP